MGRKYYDCCGVAGVIEHRWMKRDDGRVGKRMNGRLFPAKILNLLLTSGESAQKLIRS
jgi:hypothetical protein